MKVKNETHYDTFYLRRLFLACEKQMFRICLKHTTPKWRRVEVRYNKKNRRVNGRATISGSWVGMFLPKPTQDYLPTAQSVAQVYIHEVQHNLGLRHKDMIPVNKIDVSFLPNEYIMLKPAKPAKPKPNIIEIRAAKAQKKLDGWQKKLNRAKTFVRKYQRKVRYYEKRRAASK